MYADNGSDSGRKTRPNSIFIQMKWVTSGVRYALRNTQKLIRMPIPSKKGAKMAKKSAIRRFQSRLNTLNRRHDYLNTRINRSQSSEYTYDHAEADAISWVLQIVERYPYESLAVLKTMEPTNPKQEGQ